MRKQHSLLLFFLTVIVVVAPGCRKGYFDLNKNPNLVETPSLPSLLSTATHKTGFSNYNVGAITSVYVQYLANPSASAASDTYQDVDYTSTWDYLYYAMADISDMKKLATQLGSSEYLGVANTLLAYNIGLVTDLWGNAPFSEAFRADNFTPAYDKQEDLYKTGMDLLDSAIAQLARTNSPIKLQAANDLIHGGSLTKWLQTAYMLKARMLLKVSKTTSYNASAVLTAVGNAYKSNADDAGMASFAANARNPWAQVSRNNAGNLLGGWLCEQLVDHLNSTTYGVFDPRIRKITDSITVLPGVKWIGTVSGAGNRPPGVNTTKDECYVDSTSPWTAEQGPVIIATYAEMKFIEAEAALPTDPTRAYNAYLAGINANMDKLQVPAGPERTNYIAAASVGAGSLTKDLIMKEKYVATYLNPEAWNDARRYDYKYKDFTLPANAALPTFIRRVAYTQGERSKNGKNVPSAEPLSTKLWWDK
jgi:hypothetical protein